VNLPNLFTISRLVAIPLLMALALVRFPRPRPGAAALIHRLSRSPILSTARSPAPEPGERPRQVSRPLADKLLVLSVSSSSSRRPGRSGGVLVIFSRELLITILRSVGRQQGHVIAAAPSAAKTVTQMAR